MKFRIFGTIFILAVLGAVFVLTQPAGDQRQSRPAETSNEVSLPTLNINQ